MALELARAGGRIAVVAHRGAALADSRADKCGAWGGCRYRHSRRLADVTRPCEVERAAETVALHFGPIDLLVNNAGT